MKIGLSIPISGVGVLSSVSPDMILGITSDTDGTFTLPLQNATTTITVDWGDASSDEITTYNAAALTHTYASTSTNYDITISGQFGGINFNNGGDKVRLRNIQNWGSTVWSTCANAFYGCTAMTITATDTPDTSAVTSFYFVFRSCTSLTSFPLTGWDTSLGQDMTAVCFGCTGITSMTLTGLDLSSVTTMNSFASGCTNLVTFSLSGCDTSSVTIFQQLLLSCSSLTSFTKPSSMAAAQSFSQMFYGCSVLTTIDLSGLITANVNTFYRFARDCSALTTVNLTGGTYTGVTSYYEAFRSCTSLVTLDMTNMVTSTTSDLGIMIYGCTNLTTVTTTGWVTTGVTDVNNFMVSCTSMNSIGIDSWNIEAVATWTAFATGVTLPTALYDATLIAWDAQNPIDSKSVTFGSSTYTGGTVDIGTTDSTTASKLVDSTQNFITTVTIGDIVKNTTDNTYAAVTAIDSDTTLSLDTDIMISGEAYEIHGNAAAKAKYGLTTTDLWTITDGGAVAWTPASLGADLALWLDADDASTITLNGSTVSQWGDKSGNGRNAVQASASSQPTYAATGFNSKPTIQFDGVNDALSASAAAAAIGSQAFTLLGAIRFPTSASAGSFIITLREASGTITRGYITRSGANTFNSSWGNPSTSPPNITVADGTNNIIGVQKRTGGVVENFANGVAGGSTTASFAQPFGQMSFGAFLSASSWSDTWFSEVVVATGTMTTTDRQKLEGYLAHKWGLVADLPVDHPYKTTPPTA